MTRKTIVVAAAAGTLALAAGTAWAVDTDATPARVAATPTTSATSTATPTASSSGAAVLSADDAARLVRSRLGGGVVTEVEAEFEHGRPEWKVEITKDGVAYEIRIDATTGGVTRFETRDGDDRLGRDDDRGFDDHGRRHGADDDHGSDDDNSGPGGGDDGGGDH
jgi:uncharacterized membrane protein YkoI